MGDLTVRRDGALYGVTIRAILDSGSERPLYVAIRGERVEWHDPADPSAGPGGWIRSTAPTAVEAELELFFKRDKVHAEAVEQLGKWQADPPPQLVGVSSVEQQYVGLIDQAEGNGIGIQITPEREDRSSARAYATWSRGKLHVEPQAP